MSNTTYQPLLAAGILLMLTVFLFLALRQAKDVTSLFRYHLFGDDLRENRFTGSLISTNASLSGAFVLIIYYGFLYGPWAFPFVWLFWLITERTSAWTIHRTEAIMKQHGGWFETRVTLHEFIGVVFRSPRGRLYAGTLSLISYVGLIAAEIVLATHLLRYVFPASHSATTSAVPIGPFTLIVGLMLSILIYNYLSGFRGTVQTDFAQWIIMSVMILIVVAFVAFNAPVLASKYGTTFNSLGNGVVAALLNPDRQGYLQYLSFIISNIIFWGLWWPGAMDQWQRCAAARTPKISLNKTWGTIGAIPIVYFGVLTAAFLGVGVWLRIGMPDGTPTPDFLRTTIIDVQHWGTGSIGQFGGAVLAAFTFWGLICAAMSTIDSYVMTASQTFFVDMANYRNGSTLVELNKQDTDDKVLLRSARGYTIYIPVLVILVALLFFLASDVYALIYFSFSFMFALLAPLFAALMGWAHPGARVACERSLIAGGVTSLSGAVVITIGLEAALRANNQHLIFWWYQAVYWWSTVVFVIGAIVLWANWQKNRRRGEQRA